MSEQKVSGKTITHAWFRTTEMFKDDSVIGIAKQEWDDLDTRIDAALRRAKAEGMRMAAEIAKDCHAHFARHHINMKIAELDARAARIEEGE